MNSEIVWINKTDGKQLSFHISINMYIEKDFVLIFYFPPPLGILGKSQLIVRPPLINFKNNFYNVSNF